jgi:hypothetical protein
MGAKHTKHSDSTINWNNINTENISSTVPNLSSLSNEAKQLIANLNIPDMTDTQTSISVNNILDNLSTNLNHTDKQKFNQILSQMQVNQPLKANDQELSDTSPFISSEMYNYLVSATSENGNQKGGAKKSKKQNKITSKKGGEGHDDIDSEDDSTSSTSDSSSVKTTSSKSSDKKKKDKKKEGSDTEKSGSGEELSYLSSSAHTDGELSDSDRKLNHGVRLSNNVESSSSSQSSPDSSSVSTITDEKKDMMTTSISVNTDDINMVSEY